VDIDHQKLIGLDAVMAILRQRLVVNGATSSLLLARAGGQP